MSASLRLLTLHADPADEAVLASVAAAHHFELHVCTSAEHLVVAATRGEFDAVVLDAGLPGGDAYQACSAIRSSPRSSTLPVVMTTSHADVTACRRAIEAGCDELIEKPIDRHGLAMRLQSFARMRRAWAHHSRRALVGLSRLSRRCRAFAEHLELAADEVEAVELAGLVHDLGDGAGAVLEPLVEHAPLVDILRHRHERWDGTGSPTGLAGEDIPDLARVLRVLVSTDVHTELAAGILDPRLGRRFLAWVGSEE